MKVVFRAPSRFAPLLVLLVGCGDPAGPGAQPDTHSSASEAVASASATASADAAAEASAGAVDTAVAEAASAEPSATGEAAPAATGTGATAAIPTANATATAAASAAAGPDVQGEQKKGASFSAYLAGKPSYEKGKPGSVSAIVNAVAPYHVNQEYPYKFKLAAAPAGLTFPESVVRNVSRTEMRASIPIAFTADAPGTYTISGECSLSVCTASNCVIEKVPLAVTVKVE